MGITDELRKWISTVTWLDDNVSHTHEKVLAIADRIDAEHEAKVSYWQGASYKDGYDEGFASADDWLAQHEDAMAEHGWVKLPVDADGETWHVGDITENKQTVHGMCLNKHGWHFLGTVNDIDPSIHTHYHAPTVEDVLREMLSKYDELRLGPSAFDPFELMAEYAAKLQLREDA